MTRSPQLPIVKIYDTISSERPHCRPQLRFSYFAAKRIQNFGHRNSGGCRMVNKFPQASFGFLQFFIHTCAPSAPGPVLQ